MSIKITDSLHKKSDILMSSDKREIIDEMKSLINQFYDPRKSSDSACFVDGHELMINEFLTDDEVDDKEDEGWLLMKEFSAQTRRRRQQNSNSSNLSKYSS